MAAMMPDGFDEPVKPSMPPPSGRGASPRKSALKIGASALFPQEPPPACSSPGPGKSALKNTSSPDGLAAPINGAPRNGSKQPALNQISEGTNGFAVKPPSDPSPGGASPKTRGARKKKEDPLSDDDGSVLSEETPAGLPSQCFQCGNVMLSDSQYCRHCGTRRSLHGAKDVPLMAEEVKCSCGSIFASDSVFCRRCGRPRPGHESEAELSRRPSAVVDQVATSHPFSDLPNAPRGAAKALLRHAYKSVGRNWQNWLWNQAEAEASPESQAIDSIATWTFKDCLSAEPPACTVADPAVSCTGCGNKFMCDSLFCRKCGQERPGGNKAVEQLNHASVCLVCGNEFMPDAKYCRRCGTQRQEQAWRKKSRRTVAFSSNAVQDRQTCFILRMDAKDDCHADQHKAEGTENKSDSVKASAAEVKTPVPECPPVEKAANPLKDVLTEKKVKVDKVRAQLTSIPDAATWLELPLESGHPFVERPLVHAVASIDSALVALLLEFNAQHSGPYNGEKMYKGWIKPGSTLIESVQSRKGRFVGTMLGDKLSKIETLLSAAQTAVPADAAANPSDPAPAAETSGAADTGAADSTASADAAAAGKRSAGDARETNGKKSAGDFQSADVDDNAVAEMGKKHHHRSKQLRTSVVVRTALGHLHTIGHPQDTYEIQKQVDDGDTSSIWLGVHKETTKAIAIKVELKYDEGLLWEEIAVLNQLSHPNVISLHETFETPDQLYCVLDLCQGGRLFEVFAGNCEIGVQNLHALKRLMKQQVLAVRHIHDHSVCHRDIQLDNFLFVESCPLTNLELATVKLIDFTTSKRFGVGFDPMKTKICTPAYCAWEICQRGETPYTEKIDIWSLGVVFFIMLCGRQPFPGSNDFEVLKKIKKAVFAFEPTDVWKQVPAEGHDIINQMIKKPADQRFSANQLMEHVFLRPPS